MTFVQSHSLLLDDHRAVDEVLTELLTSLKNNDVKTSYARLDLLWARLAVHIRAEHLHLFPTVINRLTRSSAGAAVSEAQSLVDNLRADHDFFMRELARAVGVFRELPLETAADEARMNSVLDTVLEVKKRLTIHNEIEENQIYRWVREVLTGPEQVELTAHIHAELENRPPRFSAEVWKNRSPNTWSASQ